MSAVGPDGKRSLHFASVGRLIGEAVRTGLGVLQTGDGKWSYQGKKGSCLRLLPQGVAAEDKERGHSYRKVQIQVEM